MTDERDQLAVQVLERLEEPVEPDPRFAAELLERLLAEVAEAPGPVAAPRRRPFVLRPRLLAAAAAIAGAVLVVGIVLSQRPVEESALAAVREAQRQAAAVPPFRAIVSHRVSRELALGTAALATGGDFTAVSELSFGGPLGWRRVPLRESQAPAARRIVWDGRTLSIDRPEQRRFYVYASPGARRRAALRQLSPLATLGPRFRTLPVPALESPAAYFEERCRVDSIEEIAGQPAQALSCEERDFEFSLWLDRETGLLLKLETPDTVLEVQTIQYGVRYERDDFRAEPPPGATVVRIGGSG